MKTTIVCLIAALAVAQPALSDQYDAHWFEWGLASNAIYPVDGKNMMRLRGNIFQIADERVALVEAGETLVAFAPRGGTLQCADGDPVDAVVVRAGRFQYTNVVGGVRTVPAFVDCTLTRSEFARAVAFEHIAIPYEHKGSGTSQGGMTTIWKKRTASRRR